MQKNLSGFTLIELLVVLTMMAILVTMGVPMAQHMIDRNRSVTAEQQVLSALHYSRIAALRYHQTVTYCGSGDGKHCDGRWSAGQIVFVDANANGVFDSSDTLLRHYSRLNHGGELRWCGFRSQKYLQFEPIGVARLASGSFYYSPGDSTNAFVRRIIVNRTGRARVDKG